MRQLKLLLFVLFVLPNYIFSQDSTTTVTTKVGKITVPGSWKQLNTNADSGQTFLINKEKIIIAVAQNTKETYSFFKKKKSAFDNVTLFYNWDADFMKENQLETTKIKENAKLQYIIWKYNDGKLDNVYLFGSNKDNFLNLLVYTDKWSEQEKIHFLENLYTVNR